ncbi:MAG: ABC transporter ATP-binding protein [Bryobacteraceae bacterium]|nr:ABC transporter ATP-binding protein [Bryobacteraceae bacterium]
MKHHGGIRVGHERLSPHRAHRAGSDSPAEAPKRPVSERLRELLPDIWAMIRPRRHLLALGFLLMLINRASGLVLPASTKFLFDDVIGKRHVELLTPLILAVLGATLIQGLTSYSLTQLLSKEAQRLIAELRCKVQSHIARLPLRFYDANKSGTLVSRIMTDVEGIRNLIGTGLVEMVGGVFTALFAIIILFRISSTLTLVTLGFMIAFALISKKVFAVMRPIFRERSKINAEVTGRLTESLGGVRVVKGYNAEEREEQVFGAGVRRLLENVLKTLNAMALMGLSAAVVMGIVGAIVMYVGARQIFAGELTIGGFATFTAFLAFLIAPVFQLVGIGTQLTEAFAGLERTREVLREDREDSDPTRTIAIGTLTGEVRFEDVDFEYEPGKPVLTAVTLHALPGSVTALVGPSGSGKSTIINLLAAFYTPRRGRILVDGVDLAGVQLSSFRKQLGVVLQDTFLFDGTIRENVAFSRPEASTEEVVAACRIARVDEFAERMPDGYDTMVGERGVKLSGGQKQRVSIARAILADPRILILDEATSSLDSESEALIQEGLSYLMQGRTTFVIAHRLSTIRRASQILVVENGRILERGTHEELYALGGRYWDLYTRQHGVESNLFLAPGEGDLPSDDGSGDSPGERRPASGVSEALRL